MTKSKHNQEKPARPMVIREGVINPMDKFQLLIMTCIFSVLTTVSVIFVISRFNLIKLVYQ